MSTIVVKGMSLYTWGSGRTQQGQISRDTREFTVESAKLCKQASAVCAEGVIVFASTDSSSVAISVSSVVREAGREVEGEAWFWEDSDCVDFVVFLCAHVACEPLLALLTMNPAVMAAAAFIAALATELL